ncbi:tRNA threonylcarbamoyladenosine biosynthesis protein TsaB [Buchnera aphidicola (Panaphis juglandis)]
MYKNILSIDTSLHQTSISLFYKNNIQSKSKKCDYNHEKHILKILHKLLLINNFTIKDFHFISFTTGPGNFTGIRLGINIAQGLSIPYNIPLIGISTLKILAEQCWRRYKFKKIIVCNLANKKKVYWAQYIRNDFNVWEKKGKEELLNIKNMNYKIEYLKENWNVIGSGIMHIKNKNNPFLNIISITESHSQDLIPLTIIEIQKKNFFTLNNIKLNYLNNLDY